MITMTIGWFLTIAFLLVAGGAFVQYRVQLELDDRRDARTRDDIVDAVLPQVPQQRVSPEDGAR